MEWQTNGLGSEWGTAAFPVDEIVFEFLANVSLDIGTVWVAVARWVTRTTIGFSWHFLRQDSGKEEASGQEWSENCMAEHYGKAKRDRGNDAIVQKTEEYCFAMI